MKTPGQRRRPKSTSTASEMPLGGQIAEALGFRDAKDRPKVPTKK
jgi:hypothetical protein